ncbi:MAG TPA: PKD domain-containing protein [Vicinamibacterales bacterium]|nr:PKD domain-containing protein [Vicinamibacterales bacterium]
MVFKRVFIVAVAALVGGCSLDSPPVPGFAGPSEFALSLVVTATPDVITQDGVSTTTIQVQARDANSQPLNGINLRAEIVVNGTPVDFGQLSTRTISTNGDGRAALTYLAPPPPPATVSSDTLVTVVVTPVSSNFGNALSRSVLIRLARPGVILPPSGAPKADFFFSPTQPKERETILFDGAASTDPDGFDDIVSFDWGMGDGRARSGLRVTHTYDLAGTYNVSLTVTDTLGRSSQIVKQVIVALATAPVAAFVISPTDPVVGTSVFFNAASSKPSPGFSVVGYDWDFGDGTRIAGGQTASHTYAAAGSYNIVLTITDSSGQKGTISVSLTVGTP